MTRKQRYFTLTVASVLVAAGAPLYHFGLLDAGLLITGAGLFALGLWPAPGSVQRTAALQQSESA